MNPVWRAGLLGGRSGRPTAVCPALRARSGVAGRPAGAAHIFCQSAVRKCFDYPAVGGSGGKAPSVAAGGGGGKDAAGPVSGPNKESGSIVSD